MKPTNTRKTHQSSRACAGQRGFTLVEMALTTVIGGLAASMMLALTNQQIAFLQLYRTQSFLTEEAPLISAYISRVIGSADRFRLHDNVADALAGTNASSGPSPVVILNFAEPDGTQRALILSFEDLGDGPHYTRKNLFVSR